MGRPPVEVNRPEGPLAAEAEPVPSGAFMDCSQFTVAWFLNGEYYVVYLFGWGGTHGYWL